MLVNLARRLAFGSLDFHAGQRVCVDTWEDKHNLYKLGTVTKVVRVKRFVAEEVRYEVRRDDGVLGIYGADEVGTIIES